jgi:hypothetical protein
MPLFRSNKVLPVTSEREITLEALKRMKEDGLVKGEIVPDTLLAKYEEKIREERKKTGGRRRTRRRGTRRHRKVRSTRR